MNCNEIRDVLSLYIDDMLEESLVKEVEEHLATCVSCKKEYTDIADMVNHLREIPEAALPASFEMKWKAALAEEKSKSNVISIYHKKILKNKWRLAGSIAAVFAVGVLSFGFYQDIAGILPEKMIGSNQSGLESKQYSAMGTEADELTPEALSMMKLPEQDAAVQDQQESFTADSLKKQEAASKEAREEMPQTPQVQLYLAEDSSAEDRVQESGNVSSESAAGITENESSDDLTISRHYKIPELKSVEDCNRSLINQGIEKNSAAVHYYNSLIEDKLSGLDYQLTDSVYDTATGEWHFKIFIFRDEVGNTYNKEIVIIGKDGKIEVLYADERMGL